MTTEAPSRAGETARAARRRAILELVEVAAIGSQEELAALLRQRGFPVTQATVSRDIGDLGLVKAPRGEHHAYVSPRALAGDPAIAAAVTPGPAASRGTLPHPGVARLRRVLADYPARVARSGLTLVLVSTPGTAAAIAQAIDESGWDEQVGTLAGDNTLLVLFADLASLERWQARLEKLTAQSTPDLPGELTRAHQPESRVEATRT
jgi:transcriptional regulator of arginine metabolism